MKKLLLVTLALVATAQVQAFYHHHHHSYSNGYPYYGPGFGYGYYGYSPFYRPTLADAVLGTTATGIALAASSNNRSDSNEGKRATSREKINLLNERRETEEKLDDNPNDRKLKDRLDRINRDLKDLKQ